MSRPLYRRNLPTHVTSIKGDLGKMRRARPTGQWHTPVIAADPSNPNFPLLKNGFEQPVPPDLKHMFRWHMDGSLQFRGHLRMGAESQGVRSSGKVAYTLPGAIEGQPDFRPDADFSFVGFVLIGNALTLNNVYTPAEYHVDASSGDITVSLFHAPLPFAAISWFNLTVPFVATTATSYQFASLPDTNIEGFTTDPSAFEFGLEDFKIFPLDSVGVYVCTATVYYDLNVNNRKTVGISWPATYASSGSFQEWETAASVFSYTEHRLLGTEAGFVTGFFDHAHGSNRDVIGVALEITRLVDEVSVNGGATYLSSNVGL